MNDPTKRIDVEKSSLLSLKAELLRKQEEVLKSKSTQSIPSIKKLKAKSSASCKVETQESSKTIEYDDSIDFDRVRRKLEAKAKFYDKMEKSGADDSQLILFSNKDKSTSSRHGKYQQRQQSDSDSDDDETVEYVDVFGRSRRVPKENVANLKRTDADLNEIVEQRESQQNPQPPPEPKESESSSDSDSSDSEKNEEVEDPDLGIQFMKQKQKWKEQDEINRERTELHYADVLFDEAREHGVGYYEFSTDHDEREKQQEELQKIHETTLNAQNERNKLKKCRDEILAKRIKSAKERVRIRLGLPLEDESQNNKNDQDDKVKNDEIIERERELEKKRQQQEAAREKARKKHIRPWDKSKLKSKNDSDSSSDQEEWTPKREHELMTQNEWNEERRKERNMEFAPMDFIKSKDVLNLNNLNNDFEFEEDNKKLYFTTKKLKRRNQSPPPTMDTKIRIESQQSEKYFEGPSSSSNNANNSTRNIEDSVAAGLRYLREQIEKGNKNVYTTNKDYQN